MSIDPVRGLLRLLQENRRPRPLDDGRPSRDDFEPRQRDDFRGPPPSQPRQYDSWGSRDRDYGRGSEDGGRPRDFRREPSSSRLSDREPLPYRGPPPRDTDLRRSSSDGERRYGGQEGDRRPPPQDYYNDRRSGGGGGRSGDPGPPPARMSAPPPPPPPPPPQPPAPVAPPLPAPPLPPPPSPRDASLEAVLSMVSSQSSGATPRARDRLDRSRDRDRASPAVGAEERRGGYRDGGEKAAAGAPPARSRPSRWNAPVEAPAGLATPTPPPREEARPDSLPTPSPSPRATPLLARQDTATYRAPLLPRPPDVTPTPPPPRVDEAVVKAARAAAEPLLSVRRLFTEIRSGEAAAARLALDTELARTRTTAIQAFFASRGRTASAAPPVK